VIVIALDEAGNGKGSGRSVPGFDLGAAVLGARSAGLLSRGGGHPLAAGLSIDAQRIDALREFLAARAAPLGLASGHRSIELDAALATTGVTPALALQLERLGPFGAGNPEPVFALTDTRVVGSRPVGSQHLSCILTGAAGGQVRAIAFRARGTPLEQALAGRGPLGLAGRIKVDRYQGRDGAQFEIEDAAQLGP
jgi:single-stranded-DNA-specific exonuclease